MSKTIAVIDGNSLMHRAYHAVAVNMTAPDGSPTNAVFGFLRMLIKLAEDYHPHGIVCDFDTGRPAFRMEALETYKAQRKPMDDELRVQFPLIEELLAAMNIPVVRVSGWEGDDILGTISKRVEQLADYDTLLVTGDRDIYQLATDRTHILATKKGLSDTLIIGPDEVREIYGIEPHQVPDFLGLKGDTSDNIPGVPGIGQKTASDIIAKYGTLEEVYEHLADFKGKRLENMRENRAAEFTSRMVATSMRDVDFGQDI